MGGFIIIDTETSGLFTLKNPDGSTRPSDAPGQPRMAEFAAVIVDAELNIESTYQSYILPNNWRHKHPERDEDGELMTEMPPGAFEKNKLSFEFLRQHGKPVEMALSVYDKAVRAGYTVLGFNQKHDGRTVRAELRRAGMDDLFEQTPATCVMRSLQAAKLKIPKLNGKGGYLGLVDAAAYFGISHDPAVRHQALDDAMCCALVARATYRLGHLLPGKVHYAADTPSKQEA